MTKAKRELKYSDCQRSCPHPEVIEKRNRPADAGFSFSCLHCRRCHFPQAATPNPWHLPGRQLRCIFCVLDRQIGRTE